MVAAVLVWLSTRPHSPVVAVTDILVSRLIEATARAGGGGPIEGVGQIFCHKLWQDVLIKLEIIGANSLSVKLAGDDELLHLVVTRHDAERGVMGEACEVILELCDEVFLVMLGHQDVSAGDHEVLPYDKSHLVTKLVEPIVGVECTAPDTQGVEVCGTGGGEHLLGTLSCQAGDNAVLGDIVCTGGKEFHTVYGECELLAVLILLARDGEGAKADADLLAVDNLGIGVEVYRQLIEILRSEIVRPPKIGVGDIDASLLADESAIIYISAGRDEGCNGTGHIVRALGM